MVRLVRSAAALAVVAFAGRGVFSQDCYNDFERAQGSAGYAAVEWKPCCNSGSSQLADPARGYGKFCLPAGDCYNEGERAQGAEGYPFVKWAPCCDDGAEQVEDPGLGWGKFCKKSGGGGGGGGSDDNDPYENDGAGGKEGEWATVSANGEPEARHEATFVMGDGGKAYLLGGRNIKAVSVYDLKTNTWTDKSKSPLEIHHFQAVYGDGKIWIPSAWTGGYPYESNVDSFYVYDVNADTWGTKTAMPEGRRRGGAAVALHNGKIYVGAGNRGGHGSHATSYGWLDVYDIASDSWESKADASYSRDHTGGGIIGNMFCLAGGRDGGANNFFNKNVGPAECYDIGTGKWETKTDMPSPRAGSSYGVDCSGRLVVAGGEGGGQAYKRVDYFNGSGWLASTNLQEARHGSGVAVENCNCCKCKDLYVASGSGAQGGSPELKTLEKFTSGGC